MSVCICIPSRGRPEELSKTVAAGSFKAEYPSTSFAIALDDDDPSEYTGGHRAPRENSLGAKYNRAASYAPADTTLYVLGVDDCYPKDSGWDVALRDAAEKFKDGVGVVYFGPRSADPFQLPEGIAVTKGWIDQVGVFCPTYFPYWWHDTWIDELARFTGRYVWANIDWHKHGATEAPGKHKTMRMREVSWWAKFFDATRQMRVDKAVEMLNRLDYPEWLRAQLKQEMLMKANHLWRRNGGLRDNGKQFEREYGAESAPDPGYDQIKAEASAMLAEINKRAA